MAVELTPDQVVDRYRVVRELGRGGLATVYLVEHTTLGTSHALKVLTLRHRDLSRRLVQEGVVQARLAHPGIVPVTDVLEVEGAPGLVMAYLDGGSLEDWIAERPPDLDAAESLFRAVLDAMEHAHAQGVVHRDLKPANILLEPRPDGSMQPRIADFGIAKVVDADDPDASKTRTGMAMGTPSYMSPEQIRSAKDVDARSDVFALGCILFELMTGELAFDGPDTFTIMNRVVEGRVTDLDALDADLSPRIRRAIEGALQVDRDARFADVAALRAALDNRPIPPAATPAAPSPPRRRFGALVAVGVLALAAGVWTLRPAKTPVATPPPPATASVAAPNPTSPLPADDPPAPETEPRVLPEPRHGMSAPTPPAPKPEVESTGTPKNSAPTAKPGAPPEPETATTPAPAAPTPDLTACDRMDACMAAIEADDGLLGSTMGPSMAETRGTIANLRRTAPGAALDTCSKVMAEWRRSFAELASTDNLEVTIPAACR